VRRLPVGLGDHRDHGVCDADVLTRACFLTVKANRVDQLSLTATSAASCSSPGRPFTLACRRFHGHQQLNTLGPPLLFCVAFGLSMDYEVSLSRIKEEYDRLEVRGAATTPPQSRGGSSRPVRSSRQRPSSWPSCSSRSHLRTHHREVAPRRARDRGTHVTRRSCAPYWYPAFMRLAGRLNWWAPRRLPTAERKSQSPR